MESMTETKIKTEEEREMSLKEIAEKNFFLWNETLQGKDPKKVAELYSGNATFLPTMSPDFKKGKEEAEGYFEHFLLKNPEGKIIEDAIQALGSSSYLHSGLYNFEVDGEDGSRIIVEARFSYVWKKEADGTWKIIHHHSSVKPA
jgi:uncharacterized protein (TIGR02246 family)